MYFGIGTDEAGYGPNLGPLVIAATVWCAESPDAIRDLYAALRPQVSRKVNGAANGRLRIADSKQLYSPGQGLRRLEEGVLAALSAAHNALHSVSDLWQYAAPEAWLALQREFWWDGDDSPLPLDADAAHTKQLARRFQSALARSRVQLIAVRCRVLFPREINQVLQIHSKGELLTRATLELVRWGFRLAGGRPCHVHCDKHGGRNYYRPWLEECLTDEFIWTVRESADESHYQWGDNQIVFQARGERCLASALASMVAKYLRELAMVSFNRYWLRRMPDLKPTAGYPKDAGRFWQQIEPMCETLAIQPDWVWRQR